MKPLSRDIMVKTDMEMSVSDVYVFIDSFVYDAHLPGRKLQWHQLIKTNPKYVANL